MNISNVLTCRPTRAWRWLTGLLAALVLWTYPSDRRQPVQLSQAHPDLTAQRLDPAVAQVLGAARLGVHVLRAVVRDLDRDGDLDLVASTIEEPVVVWINDGHGHFTRQQPASRPLVSEPLGSVESASSTDIQALPPTPNRWSALPTQQTVQVSHRPSGGAWPRISTAARGPVLVNRPVRAPPLPPFHIA